MRYPFFVTAFFIASLCAIPEVPAQETDPYGKKAKEAITTLMQRLTEPVSKEDCEKGLKYFQIYRKQKPDEASFSLAEMYLRGRCVKKDPEKAAQLILPLAEKGFESAYALAGYLFYHALGVPKDIRKARYWFRAHAAEIHSNGKDLETRLFFSRALFAGFEPPQEAVQEIERLSRLEKESPEKRMRFALRLRDGDGMPKNPEEARRWLNSAAYNDDYPPAMHELARWYREGTGGKRDPNDSFMLLLEAAEAGYRPAMLDLARLYAGPEFPHSYYNAHLWLIRAQDRGADVAAEIEKIRAKMTGVEIRASEEAARKKQ